MKLILMSYLIILDVFKTKLHLIEKLLIPYFKNAAYNLRIRKYVLRSISRYTIQIPEPGQFTLRNQARFIGAPVYDYEKKY